MTRGKGKGLRPEDMELWEKVARSMDERMPGQPAPEELRQMMERAVKGAEKVLRPSSPSAGAGKASTPPRAAMPAAMPGAPARVTPPRPQAGSLDRRTRQRLARGQVHIEARLDLHGMGAEQARMRLRSFLSECRMRGLRTVLVITGKGASPFARHTLHGLEHWHAPERAGRLRRLVPEWLHEHDLAVHVAGFQPAHPKHGGGGAFYIRLRRKDRGQKP